MKNDLSLKQKRSGYWANKFCICPICIFHRVKEKITGKDCRIERFQEVRKR